MVKLKENEVSTEGVRLGSKTGHGETSMTLGPQMCFATYRYLKDWTYNYYKEHYSALSVIRRDLDLTIERLEDLKDKIEDEEIIKPYTEALTVNKKLRDLILNYIEN